jgi:hypothetical protein
MGAAMNQHDKREMERRKADEAFTRRATDLDRVEMLAVALDAFARPIPDYEPRLNERICEVLQRGTS